MLIHLRLFLRNKVLKILRLLAFGNLGSWPIIRSWGGNENLHYEYKKFLTREYVWLPLRNLMLAAGNR